MMKIMIHSNHFCNDKYRIQEHNHNSWLSINLLRISLSCDNDKDNDNDREIHEDNHLLRITLRCV